MIEASHPVPDANSERGARRVLEAVAGLGPDDLVLALMSGGASALLELPAPGLTLDDKIRVNRALLASGATIEEMNAVRKHLSAIKGGRLAAAAAPAAGGHARDQRRARRRPGRHRQRPDRPRPQHLGRGARARRALRRSACRALDGPETPKPGELATDVRLIATPAHGAGGRGGDGARRTG